MSPSVAADRGEYDHQQTADSKKRSTPQRKFSQSKATLENSRSKLLGYMDSFLSPSYKTVNSKGFDSVEPSEAPSSSRSSMSDLPLPVLPQTWQRGGSYSSISGSSLANEVSPFGASLPVSSAPVPVGDAGPDNSTDLFRTQPSPPTSLDTHEGIRPSKVAPQHRRILTLEDEMNRAFQMETGQQTPPITPPQMVALQKPASTHDAQLMRSSSTGELSRAQSMENTSRALQATTSSPSPSRTSRVSSAPLSTVEFASPSKSSFDAREGTESGKLLQGIQAREDPFQDQHPRVVQTELLPKRSSEPLLHNGPRGFAQRRPASAGNNLSLHSSADFYSSQGNVQKRNVHSTVKVLVLGAGPTGLGAAHQLQNQGCDDWLLIDAMNRPGGMAVTEVDQHGFRWDLGGHVIHSRYETFDKAAALHKDWVHPKRGGWVRVRGQWCPTPIQQSLGNLENGKKIVKELQGKGKGAARPNKESKNLGQYYRNTFGKTLNETFFEPFNKKQWAWDLEELDHTWTSLRSGSKSANVPQATDALIQLDQPKDVSAFPYPRLGTGSLWRSIASALSPSRQLYSTTVKHLDLNAKKATLANGDTVTYSRCITTIPLNALLKLVADQRPDLGEMIPNLKHSSTTVIGLGFEGQIPEVLKGKTWIFSADPEVDFHRASVTTNFSSALANGGNPHAGPRWSIMFETASSGHRVIDVRPEQLVKNHLAELQRWGAISADQKPLSVWHKHLHMGYPLPFLGRDDLLSSSTQKILPELEKYGVVSRGRFGGWRYESSNQDCAFVQGVEASDLVLKGKREKEYWPDRPDQVQLTPLDEEDESIVEKTPLVEEKLEEEETKPKRRGILATCQAYIQANYFVTESSPDIVLPCAPDEKEKMSFTVVHRALVVGLGLLAFCSSSAGLWLFALGGPAFYWFAAFLFLGQATSFLFLMSSALAKNFSVKKHKATLEEFGIYKDEKNESPTVDLYLPCCKEPLEVLENTYGYVKKLTYPADKLQVHVLDDGGMDEVKELAERYGFNYVCREQRGHLKKAGNLRHAYANTTGEYFAILDADFCPRHDFLLETVPVFRSRPDLAVLQTPQYFRTTGMLGKQTWVERGAGAVQELFYRMIQTSRDTWGGAICAGSCAVYRREALKKLGGTAPLESSEDIWTGFYLIQDGWKVSYLPIVLSCGNCPDTARALFSQQIRWCEGSCSLVLSKTFWVSKFSWKQKLLYFSGLLYYLDQALTPFILPLPSIFLVWLRPGKLLYYNLAFAVPTLLYSYWLCRFWSRARHAKSVSLVNPIQSYAYFSAFKDRLLGSTYVWVPTGDAKAHKSNRYRNARLICIAWTFANTGALAAGITLRWIGGHPWYNFVPIIALQAYSVHNLIPFMLAT